MDREGRVIHTWQQDGVADALELKVVKYEGGALLVYLCDREDTLCCGVFYSLDIPAAAICNLKLLILGDVGILQLGKVFGVEADVKTFAVLIYHVRSVDSQDGECVVVGVCLRILLGVVGENDLCGKDCPCVVVYR